MEDSSGRRRFLKSAAALGAALPAASVTAQGQSPKDKPGAGPHAGHTAAPAAAGRRAYMYFTAPEVAFVDAAVARLIPADELGPGAKEAGVTYFIDQQLFGGWGSMAKMYKQGPSPEGTPQQGYQGPLTPQEVYRTGIREANLHCVKQYGKSFDKLSAAQKDEVLRGLEEGKIELESVRSRSFFNMLHGNTIEGFFSDPIYGGNRNKIGWRLVGFPGVAAVYTEHIESRNVPYKAEPVSIQDVVERRAEVDEHGHAKHVMLSENTAKDN
jgi:gluconate 2-dehydrogenase gamma chain